jgi:tetratricopeptide (TPR) repeat protein
VDNIFNFTMLDPGTSIFWWALAGIMFSKGNTVEAAAKKTRDERNLSKSGIAVTLWVLAMLVFGFCLHRLYAADSYFYKGVEYLNGRKVPAAINLLKKAKSANPLDGRISSSLGNAYCMLYMSSRNEDYLTIAKFEIKRAICLRPTVAVNYVLLGHIYKAEGDTETANQNYLTAIKMAPHNTEYRKLVLTRQNQ